jgi:DNA (cytosine-5)-methyltransferase 1
MIYPQMLLDLNREIIVDLFAGGGGASCGIEMALGRTVDVAVNHDPAAVAMHRINHPQTVHYRADVFEVDPREVTGGRAVGLLWASPDCTYHSKARGAKPIRHKNRKRRALAWVVTRWAGQVRPRVIMLENVEEFAEWGPLVGPPDALRPCPKRRGQTFRKWVRSLERLGYTVEWRERRACDAGAPTIRKRLYLIARCDGQPIVWPAPTHGPKGSGLLPYRTAAECIDWSIPMLSIFATREEAKAWGKALGQPAPKRPLAEATMRRVARGVMRYVVDNPEPYVVPLTHGRDSFRGHSIHDPLRTVTGAQRGEQALVAPVITKFRTGSTGHGADGPLHTITANSYQKRPGGATPLGLVSGVIVPNNTNNAPHSVAYPVPTVTGGGRNMLVAGSLAHIGNGERKGQAPRVMDLDAPLNTIVGAPKHALVAGFLAKHYGGHETPGAPLDRPASTLTTQDHHHLVAANLTKLLGTSSDASVSEPLHTISAGGTHHGVVATHIQRDFGNSVGHASDTPIATITADRGGHAALVASFLQSYYGTGNQQSPRDPLFTIPSHDRFGLVTVDVRGEPYILADIAMRMLQPGELYSAQGFPRSYVYDRGIDELGHIVRFTKTEQVRMCGNSVSPYESCALAGGNLPELRVRDAVLERKPKRKHCRAVLAEVG